MQRKLNNETLDVVVAVNADGTPIGGGGGGGGADRELVVTTYSCGTAFSGASVGDTITATQIIDVSYGAIPSTIGTVWRNQTTSTDLVSAPNAANIELVGSQAITNAQLRAAALDVNVVSGGGSGGGLTDAELRASAVPVSASSLPLPDGAATSAKQDTGIASLAAIQTAVEALPTAQALTEAQLKASSGWLSETVTGRTRDNAEDVEITYGDGTSETLYFTTSGEYAGKSARA